MKATPDLVVLHDHDDVATALPIVPQGTQARVAGAHESLAEVGEEILAQICATAAGELNKAEELGHFEFHI